jgi:hypothetical protein
MGRGDNQDPELKRKIMLEMWANGKFKRKEVLKEVRDRIGRENAIRNKGRYTRRTPPRPEEINKFKEMLANNPLCCKGVNNQKAKYFSLRSPVNIVYSFKNLTHFVRENPHLFNPDDVIWTHKPPQTSPRCNAMCGLASLSPRKKHPAGSWKGWTWAETFYTENK